MRRNVQILIGATAILWLEANFGYGIARQTNGNSLTHLSEYLQYAAANNAALKASFEEWRSAIEQIPQAKALPDPKFNYELETRRRPHTQMLGISQMAPWFGTIEAATAAAEAGAKAAEKRYQAQKLKLFADVKQAFYEYSYLGRQVELGYENLELLKHFEEVALVRYTTLQTAYPDVIRAQIEVATMANDVKSLELMRGPITAKLNALLNRESFAELPWPAKEKFKKVELNHQEVISLAIKNNPDLHAMDFEIDAARQQVELAKKKFYPEMEFGVNAMYQSETTMGPGKNPFYAMVSVSLPVWTESYKAAELQAKAGERKAVHQKKNAQNDIISRTERALYDIENSARNIKLYSEILIPKAGELLAASETAYRTGQIDFLTLIDAQRTLLNYQLYYEGSVVENAQKLAELEMLVGAQLPAKTDK